MKDYTEEIMRYIDGLGISKEFENSIKKDKKLAKKVATLKQDMFLMNKVANSNLMSSSSEKRSYITIEYIKNAINEFEYITKTKIGFISALAMPSRNIAKEKQKDIYTCGNIEVAIKNKKVYLKINNIKGTCVIKKGKDIFVKTKSKKTLEMELDSAIYTVDVDGHRSKIKIKPQRH